MFYRKTSKKFVGPLEASFLITKAKSIVKKSIKKFCITTYLAPGYISAHSFLRFFIMLKHLDELYAYTTFVKYRLKAWPWCSLGACRIDSISIGIPWPWMNWDMPRPKFEVNGQLILSYLTIIFFFLGTDFLEMMGEDAT